MLLSAPLYLSRTFCQDVTAWLTFPQGMPVPGRAEKYSEDGLPAVSEPGIHVGDGQGRADGNVSAA